MATRQETEAQERAARDKGDGWVSEFAFVAVAFIILAVVWFAALLGLHYIEWGSLISEI